MRDRGVSVCLTGTVVAWAWSESRGLKKCRGSAVAHRVRSHNDNDNDNDSGQLLFLWERTLCATAEHRGTSPRRLSRTAPQHHAPLRHRGRYALHVHQLAGAVAGVVAGHGGVPAPAVRAAGVHQEAFQVDQLARAHAVEIAPYRVVGGNHVHVGAGGLDLAARYREVLDVPVHHLMRQALDESAGLMVTMSAMFRQMKGGDPTKGLQLYRQLLGSFGPQIEVQQGVVASWEEQLTAAIAARAATPDASKEGGQD